MEKRRADLIAEEIEELVFDGTYPDGTRLDENALAERFGVSRTPIREALQKLVQSGLAAQLPRRGVFVRQPGPVELIEMFEVMAELEAAAARLAARRITDDALAELGRANALCAKAVEENAPGAYYAENERFHQIIYAQSGNGFLRAEAEKLHRRLRPFRRQQLRLRGRLAQSMAEHESIVAALTRGDGPGAADAMRGHIAVQGEKFHYLMSSLRQAAE
ncbi:GntR family transcriptional regulator [Roseovarius aquimarinus]|uniref:GntR family transcriptional regulator n=1 Tax=Roseovarius aquimarinus TaxID=1229156 RepID=A0ABW7I4V6_9RHOB